MKKIVVEVCCCTHCVMTGAMDIIDSIESLKKLRNQLRINANVDIVTDKKLEECTGQRKCCPCVKINNEALYNANSETVMAKVMAMSKEGN